jgi:DNA polymerase-4
MSPPDPPAALRRIIHVDMDAFYASVEQRDDPSLRGIPLAVGGSRERGVVAAASYEARTFGVHSAMASVIAKRKCPELVFVRPRFEVYRAVSRQIQDIFARYTLLIQPLSLDEAYLDVTEPLLDRGSATAIAEDIRAAIKAETGLTASAGVSYNKFLAKIASDLQKPRGFSIIGREEAADFLADKPVGMIPGIGASAQGRLAKVGVTQIGHLRDVPLKTLFEALGRDSQRLSRLAWGEDRRAVTPDRETKSISAETTFETDLRAFDDLEPILWRLSEKVSRRLKASGLAGRSVTLKLKDKDFRLLTRTRSGFAPTQLAARLFDPARQLLKASCDGTAFRLIGIGAADLCDAADADKGDLADQSVVRQAHMEAAIDKIREKFGAGAVQKGIVLRKP